MMNLLARILSHGFAFAVVAIIVIVLIYRGEFSPGWKLPEFLAINSSPSETTEKADSGTVERTTKSAEPLAAAPAAAASEDVQAADEVPAIEPATDVSPAASSAPAAVDESSATAEPAAGTESTDQAADDAPAPGLDVLNDEPGTQVDNSLSTALEEIKASEVIAPAAEETPPEEVDTVAAEITPAETAPIAAAEPTPEAAPATEPLAVPVHEEPAQADADTPAEKTPYEVMAKARESYWLRDFGEAEQHYQQLTQIDPDNPDGYGEMGNMYFSQGKWEEAAAAFYEAGTRLVKSGHIEQAQQLVEVIRGLNGPQADDLQAQVDAAAP